MQKEYVLEIGVARVLNVNVRSIASAAKTKELVRNRWRLALI